MHKFKNKLIILKRVNLHMSTKPFKKKWGKRFILCARYKHELLREFTCPGQFKKRKTTASQFSFNAVLFFLKIEAQSFPSTCIMHSLRFKIQTNFYPI